MYHVFSLNWTKNEEQVWCTKHLHNPFLKKTCRWILGVRKPLSDYSAVKYNVNKYIVDHIHSYLHSLNCPLMHIFKILTGWIRDTHANICISPACPLMRLLIIRLKKIIGASHKTRGKLIRPVFQLPTTRTSPLHIYRSTWVSRWSMNSSQVFSRGKAKSDSTLETTIERRLSALFASRMQRCGVAEEKINWRKNSRNIIIFSLQLSVHYWPLVNFQIGSLGDFLIIFLQRRWWKYRVKDLLQGCSRQRTQG